MESLFVIPESPCELHVDTMIFHVIHYCGHHNNTLSHFLSFTEWWSPWSQMWVGPNKSSWTIHLHLVLPLIWTLLNPNLVTPNLVTLVGPRSMSRSHMAQSTGFIGDLHPSSTATSSRGSQLHLHPWLVKVKALDIRRLIFKPKELFQQHHHQVDVDTR